MNILILGGSPFLGRHLARQAAERGHQATLLCELLDTSAAPSGVTCLRPASAGDLSPLGTQQFDACIDVDGEDPASVTQRAAELRERCGHVTFISTVAVYKASRRTGLAEGDAVDLGSSAAELTRGNRKARCEEIWREHAGDNLLILRPGLVVGPHDPTDRFTYWVERLAQGGEVLCPGPRDQRVQLVDARDLAQWAIACIEEERVGTFNATGPERGLPLSELFERAAAEFQSVARLTWVDSSFLEERGVQPWSELPLWAPEGAERGLLTVDVRKARAAGFRNRRVEDTLQATLKWVQQETHRDRRAGLSAERERELLGAWRSDGHSARRPTMAGREI